MGKTYLVQNVFHGSFAFWATGSEDKRMRTQLKVFHAALRRFGWEGRHAPQDWFEAFERLRLLLESQIDLAIERRDRVANLCEAKCTDDAYAINAEHERELRRKARAFQAESRATNAIQLALISANGLSSNTHSWDVASVVTADDLFR